MDLLAGEPSDQPVDWRRRWLQSTFFGALALLVVLWMSEVAGRPLPRAVDRVAALLVLGLGAALLALLVRRLWRGEIMDPVAGRLLLLLGGCALVVHFTGLGHEIGELYFADEGIYLAQARRINAGSPFRAWFVYPHFLFYWDAFALWLADLGGPLVPAVARHVWGVHGDLNVAALVTRAASSSLAAAAVVLVFLAGRRLGGLAAGAAAGALLLVSPTFVEVAHLNLSDVPASVFSAAALLAVVALIERETPRRYLAAGLAVGLAAGSKYPAGLVAASVSGPWLKGWWRRRRPSAGILVAALVALAAFLASTPSLLLFPAVAFAGEGADILFGVRQYSQAGWQGVVRASNALYYGRELLRAFGGPAVVLGIGGLFLLGREARSRVLWLLPFPLIFAALLVALKIALRRNLLPLLPFLALFLGAGVAACWARAGRLAHGRRLAAGAVVLAAIAVPLMATAQQLARATRPTTREDASAWMRAHLPPGSFLVQEQYTPIVGPDTVFPARRPRFAGRLAMEVLRDPRHDFLLLSSQAYDRFLTPRNLQDLANADVARRYREIFAQWPLVREWRPGRLQDGPVLRLYRADPRPLRYVDQQGFEAADALVTAPAMRPQGAGEIAFAAPGAWALFKAYLEPGDYLARWTGAAAVGAAGGGRLRVRNRAADEVAVVALAAAGEEVRFHLPRPDKYFLYLELPAGSRLRGFAVGRR